MTPKPKPKRKAPSSPYPEYGLAELGLAPGAAVRFRRRESERWKDATVTRRERDGSIGPVSYTHLTLPTILRV